MKATIESAIKALATKAENAQQPHEAMNFAQAALNLAHVEATLAGAKQLEESPASVPEGWKIVPVEPTGEMVDAGIRYLGTADKFRAMLAAAPTPPVSEDQKDAERFREGWTHACNALCMEIALWIERCPHCGMPAPKAPAMQEDKP